MIKCFNRFEGFVLLFQKIFLGGKIIMNFVKQYGAFILTLLIGLIVLKFVLKLGKKAPVVGGLVDKAEELSGLE
jgi:hypothetical protein